MKLRVVAALLCISCFAAGTRGQGPPSAAKQLHALFKADWEWRLRESPAFASVLGDKRYNDRWPDASPAAFERRHERRLATVAKLKAIPPASLSAADKVNYQLFRRELEDSIGEYDFGWHLLAVSQMGGIQQQDDLANQLRFTTVKDYEDWIARLRAFPAYMDQTIALMREGIRRRMVHPRVIMERIPGQIEKQLVAAPEQSPFYKPFTEFDASMAAADRARLAAAAAAAVSEGVLPAFRRFQEFIAQEYLPACSERIGAAELPRGRELYAFLARAHTTTNLTPDQIHDTGVAEVKRIRAEMQRIIEQVGFRGSFAEFLHFLRTDPQFYYKSGEELLAAYRALSKQIDPQLVRVFRKIPRMPYGVEPIPMHLAPDNTTAYYSQPAADGSRPGTYYVNLYKPEVRPKFEMEALSIHEAVPGHHLQIALAMELGELPEFRRYGGYTAFVEGWALYSESLGEEMGFYKDPYSKFGQLTYEMWRAVRLVVDTGMHVKGWTRQQAIDFFKDNAGKTEADIINEIDRYIAWPGQALAYKIGQLKIKELRARATRELGARFDLGDFHDVVLGSGAVPLEVLEANAAAWIARAGQASRPVRR